MSGVHSRRIGDFVGDDLIETLRGEHLDGVLVQFLPVTLHLVERRDLVRPQVGRDRG